MKVLNIDKYFYVKGGAQRYYFELAKLLESNGHEVIPFSQNNEQNIDTKYKKYFPEEKYRFFWSTHTAKKLEQLIQDQKPDIAHVHLIYHHLTPSILAVLKKHNIPVVMTTHDYKLICPNYLLYTKGQVCNKCKQTKYYNCIFNKCLKNSYAASSVVALEMYYHKLFKLYEKNIDVFIAPSDFCKNKLVEFGLDRNKIKTVSHFIDLKNKQPEPEPGDYVLYFGRLSKEKGVDKLIKAVYNKELSVKLAGTGPMESELKQMASKNVEFLGHLNSEKLEQAIKNSKFIVIPSQVYETFGLVALEAFAYGKTVIANNIGALPEIVKNNETGILYNNDLAEKIDYLNNNQDKIVELEKNARNFAEQFTPEKHYEEILDIYNSLLTSNS